MPLDVTTLHATMKDVFAALPGDPAAAALALANAYRDYAATGAFAGGLPVIVDPMRDALKTTLQAAIAVPLLGSPATFAAAWAAGVTAFWLAVPVLGATVGTTNGCPGAASLVGSLTAVFGNLANTADTCADGLSSALHSATMTVTATVTPPVPPAAVPIA